MQKGKGKEIARGKEEETSVAIGEEIFFHHTTNPFLSCGRKGDCQSTLTCVCAEILLRLCPSVSFCSIFTPPPSDEVEEEEAAVGGAASAFPLGSTAIGVGMVVLYLLAFALLPLSLKNKISQQSLLFRSFTSPTQKRRGCLVCAETGLHPRLGECSVYCPMQSTKPVYNVYTIYICTNLYYSQ